MKKAADIILCGFIVFVHTQKDDSAALSNRVLHSNAPFLLPMLISLSSHYGAAGITSIIELKRLNETIWIDSKCFYRAQEPSKQNITKLLSFDVNFVVVVRSFFLVRCLFLLHLKVSNLLIFHSLVYDVNRKIAKKKKQFNFTAFNETGDNEDMPSLSVDL